METKSSDAPIHIPDYDPAWPALFEAERALLGKVLAPRLSGTIEHIGSTAVPGLAAKPIIDVMAAVKSLEHSRETVGSLRELNYQYAPYRTDVMHWFCKPSPAFRTHHLHLVPYGSDLWTTRLAFRDTLRANPALAAEYAQLKQRLATLHRADREAYTEAKEPFIHRVLGHGAAAL